MHPFVGTDLNTTLSDFPKSNPDRVILGAVLKVISVVLEPAATTNFVATRRADFGSKKLEILVEL